LAEWAATEGARTAELDGMGVRRERVWRDNLDERRATIKMRMSRWG